MSSSDPRLSQSAFVLCLLFGPRLSSYIFWVLLSSVSFSGRVSAPSGFFVIFHPYFFVRLGWDEQVLAAVRAGLLAGTTASDTHQSVSGFKKWSESAGDVPVLAVGVPGHADILREASHYLSAIKVQSVRYSNSGRTSSRTYLSATRPLSMVDGSLFV